MFGWIGESSGVDIDYNATEVIMGLGDIHVPAVNCIFIIVKHYIYVCRVTGSSLNAQVALAKIRNTKTIEKNIAERRGKLNLHHEKWSFLFE